MFIKRLILPTTHLIICIAAQLFIFSSVSHAQEVIKITASRSFLDSQLTSNNMSLDSTTIAFNNAQHLNQLFSQVSGAWLSRGNGQESLLSIRSPVFTGAGACNEFLIMQDGIPLRSPGFCNVNELFDSTSEFAGQIDLLKGAYSAKYGSSAIHGLINIKSPYINDNSTDHSLTIGADGYLKLNSQFKSTDNVPIYAGISVGHDGGYQHSSGYDQYKLLVKTQSDLNNILISNQIAISTLSQQTAGYLQQGKAAYKNAALTRLNESTNAYRHVTAINAHSTFSQVNKKEAWSLTPYIRWNKMSFLMHYLPGEPTEQNGHYSLGLQSSYQFQINNSIINSGIDFDHTVGELKQTQAQPTNSGSLFLDSILPAGKHYDYEVEANNFALYSGIEHHFSQQFTASFNLRWDTINYHYNNKMMAGNNKETGEACGFTGCRYTRPIDKSDRFNNLSWGSQLDYKFNHYNSTYLKWDNAFRAPHTSELYRLQNGQVESDINSQYSDSVELGYQFLNNDSQFKLALYQMNKSDVIFLDSQRNYVNNAKTRHRGIELDLNHKIIDSLVAEINVSFAKHTYTNNPDLTSGDDILSGNQIDTAPELISSIRVNWFYNEDNRIQFEYSSLSDYYLNPENTAKYNGHSLVNLRWQHSLSSRWQLGLQWFNLLNTAYAERADYAFGEYRYFVGHPSRVYLQLRYHASRDF